jgi:hypothetical protein
MPLFGTVGRVGDFFVSGDVTLATLGEIYGLTIASDDMPTTLADWFAAHLHHKAKVGDCLPLALSSASWAASPKLGSRPWGLILPKLRKSLRRNCYGCGSSCPSSAHLLACGAGGGSFTPGCMDQWTEVINVCPHFPLQSCLITSVWLKRRLGFHGILCSTMRVCLPSGRTCAVSKSV